MYFVSFIAFQHNLWYDYKNTMGVRPMTQQRALIAMSGGVDSSVAAYLTIKEGFSCVGGTMLLCSSSLPGQDAGCDPSVDARAVAQKLGIPFHVFDRTDAFRQKVVDYFVDAYEQGLTPNPCVRCNQTIKFDDLLTDALNLGCRWVVTGHYARIRYDEDSGRYLLYKAADSAKDQSYFLAGLNQYQLSHTRFPLGELTKEEARTIAEEQGFINARKRDSQDICFVPDGDFMTFIRRYTGKNYPCGDFLDLRGKTVGKHNGAIAYTLGQRKGLGLAMGEPVYVCRKDMVANTVTVGPNEALFTDTLTADNWNWIPFPTLAEPMRVTAKARSRHAGAPATVYPQENGTARVVFDEPQRAITPGQAVVLYDGDMVIGSGTIL